VILLYLSTVGLTRLDIVQLYFILGDLEQMVLVMAQFMRLSLPERTALISLGTEPEKEGQMANTEKSVSET
jgi:hypothetical protein